jgi:uncharacterized protein (TIGR02246 family)
MTTANAFAELYTEEATVVTAGSQQQGKDEIRAGMAAGFAGPLKGTTSMEERSGSGLSRKTWRS